MALVCSAPSLIAQQSSVGDLSNYLDLLQVKRDENWLQHEIRQFRTFPHLDRAHRLIAAGRLQEARAELEKYLAIDSRDLRVRATYMVVLSQLMDGGAVIDQAKRLLEEQPRFVPALLHRALVHQSREQPDNALKDFKAAAGMAGIREADRIYALKMAADLAIRLKSYSEALEALLALEAVEKTSKVYFRQGVVLQALNRPGEAVAAYRRALDFARDPREQRSASRALGEMLVASGDYVGAAKELTKLLAATSDPQDRHPIYLSLGNAYAQQARFHEASAAFREAVALKDDPLTLTALAQTLEREGKLADAIAFSQKALAQEPTLKTHLQLGTLLVEAGEDSKALSHLQQAEKAELTNDQRSALCKQEGFIFYRMGRYANARQLLEKAAALNPQDADLYAALGQVSLQLGAHQDAARYLRQAANQRRTPALMRALALAQSEAGNIEDAVDIYRWMLRELPRGSKDAPEILVSLGGLESRRGNHAAAARLFGDAFERSGAARWPALAQAAESLALAERWEDAAGANRRLLELANLPRSQRGEALERLGFVYIKLEKYQAAAESFRKAIAAGRDSGQLRENLAFVLSRTGDKQAAAEVLLQGLETDAAPRTRFHLGTYYSQAGRPGVAVHYFEEALPRADELEPAEQWDLFGNLGYLYADEDRYADAAAVWSKALSLRYDAAIAVAQARAERLLGRTLEAQKTLEGLDPGSLSPNLQIERWDELAQIHRELREFDKAIEALKKAIALEPSADRHYTMGLNYVDLMRVEHAVPELEEALARDIDNPRYAIALAYAYETLGRFGAAAELFEAGLKRDPDYLRAYQDLGYAYLRQSKNGRAREWFRKAIDNQTLSPSHTPSEERQLRLDAYRLRQEVARLSRWYSFIFYLAPSSRSRRLAAVPGGLGGGALPAQAGVELCLRPPGIGLRDGRVFEVFARLLSNVEPGTLTFREESLQGGVGVRYKPLKGQNLVLGAERLFQVGDQALNNWLLRGLYAWSLGFDLKPEKRLWSYTTLYGDAGYFAAKPRSLALYAEGRQGLTFNAGNRLLFTPHLIGDARHQDPGILISSYLEAGGGASLKTPLQSRYEAPRASFEVLFHYRFGKFLRETGTASDRRFKGWVLTGILQF